VICIAPHSVRVESWTGTVDTITLIAQDEILYTKTASSRVFRIMCMGPLAHRNQLPLQVAADSSG